MSSSMEVMLWQAGFIMEPHKCSVNDTYLQKHWFLGGGLQYIFLCSPLPGEMIQFDDHIFQRG